VNNPLLENNTVDSRPALLTVPQNVFNGYIQGAFPAYTVQSGDHFKAITNCEYGQSSCYAVYHLSYQIESGPILTLWAFGERYDGLYHQADVDLSSLARQILFACGCQRLTHRRPRHVDRSIHRPCAADTHRTNIDPYNCADNCVTANGYTTGYRHAGRFSHASASNSNTDHGSNINGFGSK
jgi:hypothetical protein